MEFAVALDYGLRLVDMVRGEEYNTRLLMVGCSNIRM